MSGQRKNYKIIEEEINDYIETHNIYGPHEPLNMDLRAYFRYVKENNLSSEEITPDIVEMFRIKNELNNFPK